MINNLSDKMNLETIPQLSTIAIENLRLRAYIGFQKWETTKLQDLVISYSFKYDTRHSSNSDEVQDAINYKKITKHIISTVEHQKFHLIEYLAEKIYQYIQSFDKSIQDIEVKVEKPHALRFADNVLAKVSSKDRYNTAMITLGSNINPEENFKKALNLLQGFGFIQKRTEFIKTQPLKFENQPHFLNGAILFVTKKSWRELELQLKHTEALLGRVRSYNKNAPRTIDLDITTFNNFIIDSEMHELPFIIDFLEYLQPHLSIES